MAKVASMSVRFSDIPWGPGVKMEVGKRYFFGTLSEKTKLSPDEKLIASVPYNGSTYVLVQLRPVQEEKMNRTVFLPEWKPSKRTEPAEYEQEDKPAPKKRGRKPKNAEKTCEDAPQDKNKTKRRGRPPGSKNKNQSKPSEVPSGSKRRGRPKGSKNKKR